MSGDDLPSLAKKLRDDVKPKERRHLLRTFDKCFSGADALPFLMTYRSTEDKMAGLELGQAMMDAGLFAHLLGSRPFGDNDDDLFRFAEDAPAEPEPERAEAPESFGDFQPRAPEGVGAAEIKDEGEIVELCPEEWEDEKLDPLEVVRNSEHIKAGYLMKRGGSWTSWYPRWCILTRKFLVYFQDNSLSAIVGCIVTDDFIGVRETKAAREGETCIEIETPEETFFFFAPQDHAGWLEAMQNQCHVPQFSPDPVECYKIFRTAFEFDDRVVYLVFKDGSQVSQYSYTMLRSLGLPALSEIQLSPPVDVLYGEQDGRKTCVIVCTESRFNITGRILMVQNVEGREGWLVKKEDWKNCINHVREMQAEQAGGIHNAKKPSFSGMLTITVHEGENLLPRDKIKSSPMLRIVGGDNKKINPPDCQTQVKSRTVNPQWNEVFHVKFNALRSIKFIVEDHDRGVQNDPLGACSIDLVDLSDQKPHDLWLDLVPDGEVLPLDLGRIHVTLLFKDEITRHVIGRSDSFVSRGGLKAFKAHYGVLRVTVIEGENLIAQDSNGFSDPYVLVVPGDVGAPKFKKRYATAVKKRTLNPKWNEVLVVPVDGLRTVRLRVMDWDRARRDDPMGLVDVPLGEIADDCSHSMWLPLEPGGDPVPYELGRIHVILRFTPKKDGEKGGNEDADLEPASDEEKSDGEEGATAPANTNQAGDNVGTS